MPLQLFSNSPRLKRGVGWLAVHLVMRQDDNISGVLFFIPEKGCQSGSATGRLCGPQRQRPHHSAIPGPIQIPHSRLPAEKSIAFRLWLISV